MSEATPEPGPELGGDRHPGSGAANEELRIAGALRAIDHASSWVEWPVRRVAGSGRLNPLPHAGTISVFLLGVVVVTGLYITLFFEFGHDASYQSVASMEDHAIQRVVRALHRYASAAMVLTTLVHAWRIFSAGRFTGRVRRWRWATGVAALILVWLAGVTGYWLVWDVRAQALNEIVVGLVGGTASGVGLAVDHLGVTGGGSAGAERGSGSGFLLVIWFAHLLLTVVIGWFVFRHLRRSRLPWLPPPHWMGLMGVPLVLVSLLFPLGMLPAAAPEALIGRIPLDPFVLFLLPPLLSSMAWVTVGVVVVVGLAVALLPRLVSRRDPAVVTIVDAACTGCELCVADCPYEALSMAALKTAAVTTAPVDAAAVGDSPTGAGPGSGDEGETASRSGLLAVVDIDRCVGCGVCLGSCAFGAIELPGAETPATLDVDGRPLVIACDRHLPATTGPLADAVAAGATCHPVRCAGALAPDAVRSFAERGATDIQIVGCAPNDCRYGIGNTLAAERLAGERRPHPPSRYARRVAQDWVSADGLADAVATPGTHATLGTDRRPARWESLIGVAVIAVLTALGVAFATQAPFGERADALELRIVIDHEAGRALTLVPEAGPVGAIDEIEVTAGGRPLALLSAAAEGAETSWRQIVDLDAGPLLTESDPDGTPPEGGPVEVVIHTAGASAPTIVSQPLELVGGQRLVVDLTDQPPAPGVDEGRRIFNGRTGGCSVCHSVDPGDDGVGPTLAGVATVAGSRVEGLDAEGYLRQSILLPDQYVVEGWPAGQMLPIYRDRFSEEELEAVIAYLLTLEERPTGDGSDP